MAKLLIAAEREGYDTDQVSTTMTVGELMRFLEEFDEDMPVYLSHDNGYTYGGIKYDGFQEVEDDEEDEDNDAE